MMRQWWVLTLALTVATVACSSLEWLWRADLAIYDTSLGAESRPAPQDIVIVAIDDASLAALGRWPWRRSRHAALIEHLTRAGVSGIALDLVLSEPDSEHPEDDQALARAIRAAPPVVLPLVLDLSHEGGLIVRDPIPPLAAAATAVGHAQIELDRDGVARSVFLEEGSGTAKAPELMLALLRSVQRPVPAVGERNPRPVAEQSAWSRDYRIYIPYLGPPGHFTQFSYGDVLGGRVADEALRGKLILIGMTAQGGGDSYPTPVSGYSRAMPGVEINANILQALRSGTAIRRASPIPAALYCVVPTLIACLGFLRLTPRRSLQLNVLLWAATLALSILCLDRLHVWIPCSSALASLALTYPLWSWLRLESAQRYLEGELELLAAEELPLLGTVRSADPPLRARGDAIQSRMELLRHATARVRDLRQLLADTVSGLPDPTLVVDLRGEVVLSNGAAVRMLGFEGESARGVPAWQELRRAAGVDSYDGSAERMVELRFGTPPRDLLLRLVPFSRGASGERLGTLISIVDISEMRAAQREREDVIQFLSHDLKSPASSLLGLARLQRDPARALAGAPLADRLDGLAQRMLGLLDGFIALAHAESVDPTVFAETDLRDVLQDASDEVWPLAESRNIAVNICFSDDSVIVMGDRALLSRAVVNLLNNAIKYSPDYSEVSLVCQANGATATISIVDRGRGVPAAMESKLFKRFSRERTKDSPPGTGLGLAFVRVVAAKHGGSIRFVRIDEGARFELTLPVLDP